MSKAILIVGATGNTGIGVVNTLSNKLSETQSPYHIISLTRNDKGEEAVRQATLSKVKVIAKEWNTINANWISEHNVERVYIAPYNGTSQFLDESNFLLVCREAGVKHIVVLSTMPHFIGPHSPIFYGRAHWAMETILQQPSDKPLPFTVLRANNFINFTVGDTIHQIKQGRTKVHLIPSENALAAPVNPQDVGAVAGTILALDDGSLVKHNGKIYNVSGPRDETGRDIVGYLKKYSGAEFIPEYSSQEALDAIIGPLTGYMAESLVNSINIIRSGLTRLETTPTSPEVLALYPPTSNIEDFIKEAFSN